MLNSSSIALHLFESTLWALLVLGLLSLVRIQSTDIRCWLLRLSLAKFAVPLGPVVFLLGGMRIPQVEIVRHVWHEPIDAVVRTNAEFSIFPVVALLWLAGSVVLFLILVKRSREQKNRILLNSQKIEGRELSLLKVAAKRMDAVRLSLQGVVTSSGPSVALLGVFRPRIIARRAFLENLDDEETVSAFQHEISHIVRRDHYWRLLGDLVFCVFWFHPLIWFMRSRMLRESEFCCDAMTLRSQASPFVYSRCLLKAGEWVARERFFGLSGMAGTELGERVHAIFEPNKKDDSSMKLLTLFAGLVMASGITLCAAAAATPDSDRDTYSMDEVDRKPICLNWVEPVYPEALKKTVVEGKTVIAFVLAEDGEVLYAEALEKKTTHPAFGEAAIESIARSEWKPAELDGKTVPVFVRVPVNFRL